MPRGDSAGPDAAKPVGGVPGPGARVRVVQAALHPDYGPGDTGTVLRVAQKSGQPPMLLCAMDRTGQDAAFYPEEVEPLPPG